MDYAREKAPRDVHDLLDWLADEGFTLVWEQGGLGESFGNALLMYERSHVRMLITRDRGQWLMEIATGGDELIPLHVLVTAREAGTPVLRADDLRGRLPEVLPEGVVWRTAVPGVVAWLESGQRDKVIGEARAAWRQAMINHLKPRARPPLDPGKHHESG